MSHTSSAEETMRVDVLSVLGGALKNVHENEIIAVRHFGARSDETIFSLADLRYAVNFLRERRAGRRAGVIDALPGGEEEVFRLVCHDLVHKGALEASFAEYQHQEFSVRLVPKPFGDNWQFVRYLAGGGQSRTLEVVEKQTNTRGVLKLLAGAETPEERRPAIVRFVRECSELQSIANPAVITLLQHNLEETRGALGYITPLGIPLVEYWNEEAKSLEPSALYDRAYQIVYSLAQGIAALHDKGLVHRDLKPDNIVLINNNPVIIDLGLVTNAVYQEANLTETQGRQVANSFNPPVVHGLAEEDPRRDIAGLGWLYGFLLGKPLGGKRRPDRFHWRFHRLVEESRSERARAVLAVCFSLECIPRTVAQFCEMMGRLGLDTATHKPIRTDGPSPEFAEQTHANKQAEELRSTAAEREQLDIAIQLFAQPIAELRAELIKRCISTPSLPISQYDVSRIPASDGATFPPTPTLPAEVLMRTVYSTAANSFGSEDSETVFFSCCCGSKKRFNVSASLRYRRAGKAHGLNFDILLICEGEFSNQYAWNLARFSMQADGQFRKDTNVATVVEIATIAQGWCYDKANWERL